MHKTLNNSFDKQRNGAFIFIGYIDFFDDLQITNHKPNLMPFFRIIWWKLIAVIINQSVCCPWWETANRD